MALGGVFMSDTDGNIGTSSTTSTEKVTGLLFDISKQGLLAHFTQIYRLVLI